MELSKIDNARFSELKRTIIGITNTMLTSTLKDLEEKELINRIQFNEVPPYVEYSLTDRGKALFLVFEAMAVWGTQYL
ncbi:MAG: winged helix-turn-helix transcriptional regulator [Sarcina ventriculi]